MELIEIKILLCTPRLRRSLRSRTSSSAPSRRTGSLSGKLSKKNCSVLWWSLNIASHTFNQGWKLEPLEKKTGAGAAWKKSREPEPLKKWQAPQPCWKKKTYFWFPWWPKPLCRCHWSPPGAQFGSPGEKRTFYHGKLKQKQKLTRNWNWNKNEQDSKLEQYK